MPRIRPYAGGRDMVIFSGLTKMRTSFLTLGLASAL
jgi:hypothetical protein